MIYKKLTDQELKVYKYILNHTGCTTHDITRDTFVQKPCARISDMKKKGVDVVSIGEKKYPGTRASEMYAIRGPLTKRVSHIEIRDGRAIESFMTVPV